MVIIKCPFVQSHRCLRLLERCKWIIHWAISFDFSVRWKWREMLGYWGVTVSRRAREEGERVYCDGKIKQLWKRETRVRRKKKWIQLYIRICMYSYILEISCCIDRHHKIHFMTWPLSSLGSYISHCK